VNIFFHKNRGKYGVIIKRNREMQDFFVFFLVFSLYFVSMKKILLYWLLFFCLFFGTILIGYWASFPSEVVIGALFCFYFLFQGFALKKGLK